MLFGFYLLLSIDENLINYIFVRFFSFIYNKSAKCLFSKSVTWADDPHNNYKKEELAEFYGNIQPNEIDENISTNDTQQEQPEQQQQHVYSENSVLSTQSEPYQSEHLIDEYPIDQSDSINLNAQHTNTGLGEIVHSDEQSTNANNYYYDGNAYQTEANDTNQNMYPDQAYYYADNQYAADQQQYQQQPLQQQQQYEPYEQQSQQEVNFK